MTMKRERGVTLVIALLILLILLVMTVGFTFETRTQASHNAAIKLISFDRSAAFSKLNEEIALLDAWVTPSADNQGSVDIWRFGSLLKDPADPTYPEYGSLYLSSYAGDVTADTEARISMNAGLLERDFRVYVNNNRDDPAFMLTGADVSGKTMDSTWDTDGKIVMTIQVFEATGATSFNPQEHYPIVTLSALVQPTGVRYVELPLEPGSEGDDLTTSLNAGSGSADAGTNPGGATSKGIKNYNY